MNKIVNRPIKKKTAADYEKELDPIIVEQMKKDRVPVKIIFRNFETPGGTLRFSAQQYPGDKMAKYELTDGFQYTIPRGIANYLAKNCAYPVHAHTLDAHGRPAQTVGKMVNRFGIQSLEFMDDSFESRKIQEVKLQPITM